jgi:hypothetical protein
VPGERVGASKRERDVVVLAASVFCALMIHGQCGYHSYLYLRQIPLLLLCNAVVAFLPRPKTSLGVVHLRLFLVPKTGK